MADYINLNDFVQKIADEEIKRIATKGRQLMKYTVEDIVEEWYSEFQSDGQPMANTFAYATSVMNGNGKDTIARVEFHAFSDPELYRGTSAEGLEWAKRYGMSDMELYVYSLQMYRGIVGLPEYANFWESRNGEPYNRGSWSEGHNMYYHEKEPLISYLPKNNLWKQWENDMVSIIER